MRSKTLSASVAVMFVALCAINMRAQSGANTVTAQVAAAKAAADEATAKKMVRADGEWSGDDFVKQSEALARGTK